MKVIIKVEYQNKEYISNPEEINKPDIDKLEKLIKDVIGGSGNYFQIEKGSETYFFGQEAVKNAVITIIKD